MAAQVDAGEASAIALALEKPGCTLILDDYKARKLAEKLAVSLTGTFGILLRAKRQGLLVAIKPLLEQIKQTNFRFSAALEALNKPASRVSKLAASSLPRMAYGHHKVIRTKTYRGLPHTAAALCKFCGALPPRAAALPNSCGPPPPGGWRPVTPPAARRRLRQRKKTSPLGYR